jgi:hypothetical protein
MNEKTLDFLEKNGQKVVSVELEFVVIYNSIVSLNLLALSEYTRENTKYRLSYCVNSLIFRTIEKFPECASYITRYKFDDWEFKDENEDDDEDEDEDED